MRLLAKSNSQYFDQKLFCKDSFKYCTMEYGYCLIVDKLDIAIITAADADSWEQSKEIIE